MDKPTGYNPLSPLEHTVSNWVRLENDFHGTSALFLAHGRDCMQVQLSPRNAASIRRQLCPFSECRCGGMLGERGPQSWTIEPVNPDTYPRVDCYVLTRNQPSEIPS